MSASDCKDNQFCNLWAGNLEVRLATSEADVVAAQLLRYRVFYEEMAAIPTAEMAAQRRDFDAFDADCDHLLVIDHSRGDGADKVVGTYRLIRREAAKRQGGFYSSSEYNISKLEAHESEILELGRSCVDVDYRSRLAMQLLWQSIVAYVYHYDIAFLFGCASLPGTDVAKQAEKLSYLYHYHLAPPALRPRALDQRYVQMNLMAEDEIDTRAALASMPPLIKGYLRVGCFVGDGAVIDEQFNTIDVCIVVKSTLITARYARHYERSARLAGAA